MRRIASEPEASVHGFEDRTLSARCDTCDGNRAPFGFKTGDGERKLCGKCRLAKFGPIVSDNEPCDNPNCKSPSCVGARAEKAEIVQQSLEAPAADDDGVLKTWTGKPVTQSQWKSTSEWQRHGCTGKVWNGLTRQWKVMP